MKTKRERRKREIKKMFHASFRKRKRAKKEKVLTLILHFHL